MPGKIGLYYHIPFCTRLCHYCDFVKTAWYEEGLQLNYLRALEMRTEAWLKAWRRQEPKHPGFSSVFFGGGTPSLIDRGYEGLFRTFRSSLLADAEVSLEANPEHITEEKLKVWSELGFNRLSLGVQSFQTAGLKFLTREHSPEDAAAAVAASRTVFTSLNIDLIYGWPGQTEQLWLEDIEQALTLGATHLSLYSLTYEGRTPFARRVQRGVLTPADDTHLERLYLLACERLKAAGMLHEEISNWAYPPYLSRHNALYWHGESCIGIGSGSHSHISSLGPWGRRWKQDDAWRKFAALEGEVPDIALEEMTSLPEYTIETDRDGDAWVLETVSSGLRSLRGINLNALCTKTGYILQPRPAVASALASGLLQLTPDGQLTLTEAEWYRETRWALEVSLSLGAR